MDKKLLDSLNNLSMALEEIASALGSREEASSSTAKALQGGFFINEIKEINIGVKQLQKDTKQILSNQQTILRMAKDGNKDSNIIENMGKGNNGNFKEGIGVILLIATAVLALGVSFNLIGKVNFASIIALSIALPLLAIGFTKIVGALKKDGFNAKEDSKNFLIVTLAISLAISLSSWILSTVTPLSFSKLFTAILISGAFLLLAPTVGKMVNAFKGMSFKDLIKDIIFLPLIMPAIALGIALSSYALSLVKPIGFSQFVSTVFISLTFAVISFGIKQMINSFKGMDVKDIKNAAIFLPLILPAIALGIVLSSYALSLVKPISFSQFVTSVAIGALFVVLSYGIGKTVSGISKLDWKDIPKIPVYFALVSLAISVSSWILSTAKIIEYGDMLKIGLFGITLGISVVAIATSMWVVSKLGLSTSAVVEGALLMVVISAAIMASSWVLSLGKYTEYPDVSWSAGVSISILAFSIAAIGLGAVAMTGIGALAIVAGAAMVLVVAASIVATSMILSKGSYNNGPPLGWAMGVGLVMTGFGLAVLTLGTFIVGTFGLGALALAAGTSAVLLLSQTIVDSAAIFKKGNFTGGPTKDWAMGVALAIGSFAPVYGMLMANNILKIFGIGGVGPDDFASAIRTISLGITDAASYFNGKTGFEGGPKKEWAEGVGLAIGAFAPVYEVLAANSGWFSSGVSVDDMSAAIQTISRGIVDAADFFSSNNASFDITKVPKKEWGEGVSAAIMSFSPIFDFLNKNTGFWTSGKEVIADLNSSIKTITWAIVNSSRILTFGRFNTVIPSSWITGFTSTIQQFVDLSNWVSDNYQRTLGDVFGNGPLDGVLNSLVKMSSAYDKLAKSISGFSNSINGLDLVKVSAFKSFTGNLAVLSAMDSNMFNNMLNVLESKSSVFSKLLDAPVGNNKSVTNSNAVIKTDKFVDKNSNEGELKKLDRIIELLYNINIEVGGLDEYISSKGILNRNINTGQ